MKQFNLNEYLQNPSRKVVTRDGRNVKIYCTNFSDIQPIIAQIEGLDYSSKFYKNGKYIKSEESPRDLFFSPEKHEGWINIYKNKEGYYPGRFFCSTKEEAVNLRCIDAECITTVKVEWEE